MKLIRETRTNSGFRSFQEIEIEGGHFKDVLKDQLFPDCTFESFWLNGIGRVLAINGDGWRRLFYSPPKERS